MSFEAARKAGTFLHEFGVQRDMVERATLNVVDRMVADGTCPESRADEVFFELYYHARLTAFQLWECLDSPVAPPVPSHLGSY